MTRWSAIATVELFFDSDVDRPDREGKERLKEEATARFEALGCNCVTPPFVLPARLEDAIRNSS